CYSPTESLSDRLGEVNDVGEASRIGTSLAVAATSRRLGAPRTPKCPARPKVPKFALIGTNSIRKLKNAIQPVDKPCRSGDLASPVYPPRRQCVPRVPKRQSSRL